MARWTWSITLGAVDVSLRIVGDVTVQAEESTARIASFVMKPPPGPIDPNDWAGAAVTLDYVLDPDGTPTSTRLFTGRVNLPTFDPDTGLVSFDCSDDLQGHFEAMDQATILTAITGGRYAVAVFGEREGGWQQALDVLATVPKSYDLDKDGITPALTDWTAKVIPDYSYTAATIVDDSVALELSTRRDLVNRVSIAFQYRYTRLHHREHTFGWGWANTFCGYFLDSHQLPNRDMIQSSATGTGWLLQGGIVFETLPESGVYDCNGTVAWNISEADLNQLVTNATWTAVRRWTQTITESYTFEVSDASSITLFGISQEEDGAGQQTEYDDAQWDISQDATTPAWSVNVIGDYTEDQLDRADADNTVATLLQLAATRIRSTHRQNFITARVLINPALERSHTVALDDGRISGTGKVYQLTHILDVQTGAAQTEITLAVSRSGTGGIDDPLTAPAPPSTAPVHLAPPNSTVLPTRIGNDDTVPNFDPAWEGFTGNYTVAHGTPLPGQIYPWRIRIVTPDIETESRDAYEVTATAGLVYNVQAPNEALSINA